MASTRAASAKKSPRTASRRAAPARPTATTPKAKAAAPVKPAKAPAKVPAKAPAKAARTPKAAPAVAPAAEAKPAKTKLVRDSFTIPKSEYAVLSALKERATTLAHSAKKSELLRAGIQALAALGDAAFLVALKAVPAIKTGRPKSRKAAEAPHEG